MAAKLVGKGVLPVKGPAELLLGIGSLHLRFGQLPRYGCDVGLLGPLGGFCFGPKLGVFGEKPSHGFPEPG